MVEISRVSAVVDRFAPTTAVGMCHAGPTPGDESQANDTRFNLDAPMAIENQTHELEAISLVSDVISTWRSGNVPNASDVLAQHPQLRGHHSLVLDLAYEEYCLRREAGERVAMSTFCDRFPTVRQSLRKLLATHECIEEEGEQAGGGEIQWPATESMFLGFQLIREIGRGAFARVYLATEPALGDRLVVVKVSRRGGGEAETLGRLRHRNIVPVFSVQEEPLSQLTAICMPYLGSGTLLKAIDTGYVARQAPQHARLFIDVGKQDSTLAAVPAEFIQPDPHLVRAGYVEGCVHLAAQLAEALEHAHQAGICHRDLKPSNVLLAPSGRPLLLDFNLSSDERLPRTLVGGTLPYMPPEQLRGVLIDDGPNAPSNDPRGDLFGLGVILYELLTGQLPHGDQMAGEDAHTAAFRILANQLEGRKPITTLCPDLDQQLATIVDRCLQREPEDRYPSARQLAEELRGRLGHVARLQRWAHRRRFLLTATASVLGIAGTAAGVGFAVRPPLELRRYRQGIEAFDLGQWNLAIKCFSDARRARPQAWQPLLARGQTCLHAEQYDQAAEDLRRAYDLHPSGLTAAWAGYASQETGISIQAGFYYEKAVKSHRFESADVLNNLGHWYRSRRGFHAIAFKLLSRAVEVDPQCQFAYLNRALLLTNQLAENSPDAQAARRMAIEDAQRAVAIDPTNAQAHFVAAYVHLANPQARDREEMVVEHLRSALDHGYDREKLLFESGFDERFTQPLIDSPVPDEKVPVQQLLLAPPTAFPPFDLK